MDEGTEGRGTRARTGEIGEELVELPVEVFAERVRPRFVADDGGLEDARSDATERWERKHGGIESSGCGVP